METREKQAYLIEAHQCDEMLLTLLRMLDVPWNDIFIHMDSKNMGYQPETVERYLKHAKVFQAERYSVVWGGISQVKAELSLLKAAVSHGPYQHYHLISGVDLPIKTPEQIRDFFEANPDKEFVSIHMEPLTPYVSDRVYCSHLFPDTDLRQSRWKYYADTVWIFIQHMLHLKYNRDVVFKKGSNWFSCTDGFARYLLSKEDWIIKTFTKTICSDELFAQTLLFASPYIRKEPELVQEIERLYGPQ